MKQILLVEDDTMIASGLIYAWEQEGYAVTHCATIAQAKAGMSLNIARTVLSRVVQGWKDIINTR